ncbi:MAG: ankyrin repeat domain-containing protein [Alphaproteobacteria bacterium]|nr:ankyrin repeat domain-containing protein [Alphaproteobacteria bacterium]
MNGGLARGKAETTILVNPEAKKMCHVFLTTLNKKLSESDRQVLTPRIEAWKAAHPRPPVRSTEEKKKIHLTRRLAFEISSPSYMDPPYDIEGIKAIIVAGADVNLGKGLMVAAAKRGHLDMMQVLVEGGGNVDIVDAKGSRPISHAARKGFTDVVKYLISKGAKINIKDGNDDPVLSRAVEFGNADI